jgi:hypothetical protein
MEGLSTRARGDALNTTCSTIGAQNQYEKVRVYRNSIRDTRNRMEREVERAKMQLMVLGSATGHEMVMSARATTRLPRKSFDAARRSPNCAATTHYQHASEDTHQAAGPSPSNFRPRLASRHCQLCLGSPRQANSCTRFRARRQASSTHCPLPSHTASFAQAPRGAQDTIAQAIPVASEVITIDAHLPTQQCQSRRMDEHKKRVGNCPAQD